MYILNLDHVFNTPVIINIITISEGVSDRNIKQIKTDPAKRPR